MCADDSCRVDELNGSDSLLRLREKLDLPRVGRIDPRRTVQESPGVSWFQSRPVARAATAAVPIGSSELGLIMRPASACWSNLMEI